MLRLLIFSLLFFFSKTEISISQPIGDKRCVHGESVDLVIQPSEHYSSSTSFFNISEVITPTQFSRRNIDDSISQIETTGYSHSRQIKINGNYAYLVSGDGIPSWEREETMGRFQIIDISNPKSLQMVSTLDLNAGFANAIDFSEDGKEAYVLSDEMFRVIDISNPNNPIVTSKTKDLGLSNSFKVSGTYAYIVMRNDGLLVVDLSDDSLPTVGTLAITDSCEIDIEGNYAYIGIGTYTGGNGGMRIVNISDPTLPVFVGSGIDCPNDHSTSIKVNGDTVYITGQDHGFYIYSIADIQNPVLTTRKHYKYSDSYYDVCLDVVVVNDEKAYVATAKGVRIIDISNPLNPKNEKMLFFSGDTNTIDIANGYFFSASHSNNGGSHYKSRIQVNDLLLNTFAITGVCKTGIQKISVVACNKNDECLTDTFSILGECDLCGIGGTPDIECSSCTCHLGYSGKVCQNADFVAPLILSIGIISSLIVAGIIIFLIGMVIFVFVKKRKKDEERALLVEKNVKKLKKVEAKI